MTEKDLSIKELLDQIDTLPEFEQKAMHWLIKNMAVAEELTKGKKIPQSTIEEWMQSAARRNDHALLALAIFKKVRDDNNPEEESKTDKIK